MKKSNMLDQKVFTNISNTKNGDVNGQTKFYYSQNGEVITAKYEGGGVLNGSIIGKMLTENFFEIYYQHITVDGMLRAGHCETKIDHLQSDLIRLIEKWQWLNGDLSTGASELIEVKDYINTWII